MDAKITNEEFAIFFTPVHFRIVDNEGKLRELNIPSIDDMTDEHLETVYIANKMFLDELKKDNFYSVKFGNNSRLYVKKDCILDFSIKIDVNKDTGNVTYLMKYKDTVVHGIRYFDYFDNKKTGDWRFQRTVLDPFLSVLSEEDKDNWLLKYKLEIDE